MLPTNKQNSGINLEVQSYPSTMEGMIKVAISFLDNCLPRRRDSGQ